MRIIIWGLGKIYEQYKNCIPKNDVIVAYIDNNKMLCGKLIDGIKVYLPQSISELQFDKIILMSNYAMEMKSQLLEIGCNELKILHYAEYFDLKNNFEIQKYIATENYSYSKKCLIITSSLGYHGGALVAVYAALELKRRGYQVTIASYAVEPRFLEEFINKGITFYIVKNLQFLNRENLRWVNEYDYIIVNTYPMIKCAIEISKFKEILFWIHEPLENYVMMDYWIEDIRREIDNENLKICAVSDIAKNNFIQKVKAVEVAILAYGIPNIRSEERKETKGVNFAVIGTIQPIKQQHLFLEAINMLDEKEKMNNQFYIIGTPINKNYAKQVLNYAKKIENVVLIDELSRTEMEKMYTQLDILVIPSREETMSLVATEAMMKEKICIVSEKTGMAEYIHHGKNGFICRTGSAESLAEQMKFCLKNISKMDMIKKRARDTYKTFFTLEEFGNRLERILLE